MFDEKYKFLEGAVFILSSSVYMNNPLKRKYVWGFRTVVIVDCELDTLQVEHATLEYYSVHWKSNLFATIQNLAETFWSYEV